MQRTAGNQAVGRLLRRRTPGRRSLARWTPVTVYTVHAAAGTAVFKSQALVHDPATGAPRYMRNDVASTGAGLQSQESGYTPVAPGGAWDARGTWNAVGGAAAAAQPPLKVSQNGRIAVERTHQPRVFFIDPLLVPNINATLTGDIEILLLPGVTIDVPAPFNTTLTQATVGRRGQRPAPPKRKTIEKLLPFLRKPAPAPAPRPSPTAPADRLSTACDDLARLVTGNSSLGGSWPAGPSPDAAAAPDVGEAFGFRSSYDQARSAGAFDSLRATHGGGGTEEQQIEQTITVALTAWAALQAQVAGGGGFGGHMDEAVAMMPGWGTHFEGVIGVDGTDRLTLANYNRKMEVGYEGWRLFAAFWAGNAAMRAAFVDMVKTARPIFIHVPLGFAWKTILDLMDPRKPELYATLGPGEKAATDDLEKLSRTATQVTGEMYYFELYGTNDTFFQRYLWGGRDSGGQVWSL